MTSPRFDDLRQHADVLRLRNGERLTLRFVEPGDAAALQDYVRSLSANSRYNRFLGAMSELSRAELEHITHAGIDDRFSVIATVGLGGIESIVGEARYAFDADSDSLEFGLSVDDRWQGRGIGSAILNNLQCRAAAFGAKRLFGDTLRSNAAMIGLARSSGFAFRHSPDDWKLVRLEKIIDAASRESRCVSWRLSVPPIAQHAAA